MNEAEIKEAAESYAMNVYPSASAEVAESAFIAGAEANAPGWIPVIEKMPPPQYEDSHFSIDCLLLISPNSRPSYIRVGYHGAGWNISDGSPLLSSSVTHWMPLPSSPKSQP